MHDQKLVYGIQYFLDFSGQTAIQYIGQTGYRLSAALLGANDVTHGARKKRKMALGRDSGEAGPIPGVACKMKILLSVRAMVKAGDILFVAGPPDGIDKNDPLGPFEGRGTALLRAFNAKDGKPQAEVTLSAQPVFDGLAAANGKLYMAHTSGALSCWK